MSTPESQWSRHTWHRRASAPVTYWLIALIVAGLIHPLLPEYRWVLIHLFTLGAITNSIVVWSQHFTERFLHQKVSDEQRPAQLHKIWLLNAGITVTILGQVLSTTIPNHWIITCTGAAVVSSALIWHAISLARQFLSADRGQHYASAVIAYIASACCLPFGAIAGGILSTGLADPWHSRLILAHTAIMMLGFLGFAALGSLSLLYPAVWRTRLASDPSRWSLALIALAVPTISAGALIEHRSVIAGGLMIYILAWLLPVVAWVRASISVIAQPRDRIGFAAVSVGSAPLWLLASLIYLISNVLIHDDVQSIALPTTALLIGFGAQLLIGVMSFLLPSIIGGGPGAVRTGTYVLGSAGLFRWVLINGGLIIWLSTDNSWLRVCASLFSLGALAVFIPLMAGAVKAQRAVVRGTRESTKPMDGPRVNQITAGLATLALLIASCGGLTAGPSPVSEGSQDFAVTINAGDMHFSPDLIHVPAGETLEVTVVNDDDMVHDLKFANGAQTGRVTPGKEITITVGVIDAPMEGWCTIAGHRAQGMDLLVLPETDAQPSP